MRVAIVHHWYVSKGGGERVAEALASLYPQADLFALVADPARVPQSLAGRKLTTSFLDRLPLARRAYRHLLPFYPLAVEQLDLTGYDLVLTSDSGPMKGIIVSPSAVHVCYCHSPMRYLWDQYHDYRSQMGGIARVAFTAAAHYVRNWDQSAAQRVTRFAANSRYVAARIRQYYGRESTVIYPPVDTASGRFIGTQSDAYLTVSRLTSYKRVDLLIEACNRLSRRLRIVGKGPEESRLRSMAGNTIEFLGEVGHETLWNEYARCSAFLYAAEEDFGMALVEAQACGRPVIALGRGGALESVVSLDNADHRTSCTGLFYYEQTASSAAAAIRRFELNEHRFQPTVIRKHAARFGAQAFRRGFQSLVDDALQVSPSAARLQVCP
jgi:glycosyltransferase involved in cell wall biosynthesis